jgi:hypothetical protein
LEQNLDRKGGLPQLMFNSLSAFGSARGERHAYLLFPH